MSTNENTVKNNSNISVKSFISSIAIIFGLMVVAYILTFIIPSGEYDTNSQFNYVDGNLPFYKWLLSPFLVLGAEGSSTLIAVIAFLLVIGGVFECLTKCGFIKYMLDKIVIKFEKSRYTLMAVLMLFFMSLGSLIGSFEECVPLVPIVVALSISLGWDVITGVAMSLLATGCGFAAGVFNPFTVGFAQKLIGLPMFSGAWLRAVSFVLIYALLLTFVMLHAKKIEKPVNTDTLRVEFVKNEKMDKAIICFASILGTGIAIVLLSPFITFLQDYTMIIVAVMFLVAGVVSSLVAGMNIKILSKTFLSGLLNMLPAVLMILMASSIRYILEEAKILDTIVYDIINLSKGLPKAVIILLIYILVLLMNFFVASGSAKATMLIPIICPIANAFGIPSQLCIIAYAFGDGFSNVFYPTNPALLISLSLADLSYSKWAKWSVKFQACNLLLTSLVLLFGLLVGYGL